MLNKLDTFLSWLLKEGITFMIFISIVIVIVYGLFQLFNSPHI